MLCIKYPLQLVKRFEHLMRKGAKLYVSVDIKGAKLGQTRLVEYISNPRWEEQIQIYCAHMASKIAFTLKEYEAIGETFQGKAYLPVSNIKDGEEVDTWLDILDNDGKIIQNGFKLHVKVHFIEVISDLNWNCGIKTPEFSGVPSTFFKQKKQCKVTLYQDAHVAANFVPKIPLTGGKYYEPRRCWEDIFNAITNARHLIYITGWSVNTDITLIRRDGENSTSLGNLLVQKAEDRVRVLMLIWEDKTSLHGLLEGQMLTHFEETYEFFKNSKVKCVVCPRNPDNGTLITDYYFSHHQKTVIVDSGLSSENDDMRRIVSFVGGIDLCDGRYDTQVHSLFRTLSTGQAHHDDFHQPNFNDASINKGGPREPWHDIHCRLEGSAAWDVLCNFEQRWRMQGTTDKDGLLNMESMASQFISPSLASFPDDHESWNVQVFRSIDGQAALGFPDSPEKAAGAGLLSGKDGVIERSIQDAYIHAIRRAKRFIYIENQYFIGSSFDWKEEHLRFHGDIEAFNLIPKELSLKIVSKIEKGERFTVYVVLPMWPEGKPNRYSVQDMLRWQKNTMEMMYNDVAKALQAQNSKDSPEDYLLFFCLGNREVKMPGEYEPPESPKPDPDYGRAQAARRFMIYVHSKMMIGNSLLEIKHTSILNTSIKFDIN